MNEYGDNPTQRPLWGAEATSCYTQNPKNCKEFAKQKVAAALA
jgi:hypothetical protein